MYKEIVNGINFRKRNSMIFFGGNSNPINRIETVGIKEANSCVSSINNKISCDIYNNY